MKKTLLIIFSVLLFTGCSSTKKLTGYEGPTAMARVEVVQAQRSCIHARLKPTVEYVVEKTGSGNVMVPINVHCDQYVDGK